MNFLKWTGVILITITVGFLVEWIKINVNFNIEQGGAYPHFFELSSDQRALVLEQLKSGNPYDYYHSHYSISLLNHLSLSQLKLLKWIQTVAFVAVFFGINAWMVRRVVIDARATKWLLITYISAFTFALLIYLVGLPSNAPHLFYNVSRKMIGALQSPIPAMMNWAAWKLYNHQYADTKS
ncbi:MAG: hypothetical protein ACK4WD_09460 [Flavobacteriales bacterium]|jgi:hypothetical protein